MVSLFYNQHSSYLAAFTIFVTVPSAPVDIGVESVNSTAVAIKWSPPLSPNAILLFYKITYDGYKISEVFSFGLSTLDV